MIDSLKYSLTSNRVGLVLPSSRKDVLNRGKMPGHRSEANATSRTTGTKTSDSQLYFFQTDALETWNASVGWAVRQPHAGRDGRDGDAIADYRTLPAVIAHVRSFIELWTLIKRWLKKWSGHGLTGRTASYGPVCSKLLKFKIHKKSASVISIVLETVRYHYHMSRM